MTTKINKEVYVNLILYIQKAYKLPQSKSSTLLLFDENMLSQQLATLLDTIDNKSPNSIASDGIGDFGVHPKTKPLTSINAINKQQLILAALNKLNKEDLVNFTFKIIQQNSNQKDTIVKNRLHRGNSVDL